MLQDKYAKDKFFDSIYHLTDEMDPELGQIDRLLEDEDLYQLIRTDFAKRHLHTESTGRRSTPVEVVLRMLTVKRLYAWSYPASVDAVGLGGEVGRSAGVSDRPAGDKHGCD